MGVFFTAEELKKNTDAEIEKMHMFLLGSSGTPSVRDSLSLYRFHFCERMTHLMHLG